MPHNPFVPYLNRSTTASPDHQAAFDDFIGQTPPPGGAPLRLETRTEAFVRAASRTGPRSSSPATPASPGSAWRGELRGTQGYAVSNTAASG